LNQRDYYCGRDASARLTLIYSINRKALKEVRNRIQSVSSTQQITKAMKMVAAAKLRRAQDNIIRMRPYAQRLNTILADGRPTTS
jgi:ATP synthase F1 gamma subunit